MKKGFVLAVTLIVFMFVCSITTNLYRLSYNNITIIKNDNKLNQMMEIEEKVIPIIKERFYNNRLFPFIKIKNGSLAIVTFEDNIATINIIGRYNYTAYLEYNNDYDTVEDYYYE